MHDFGGWTGKATPEQVAVAVAQVLAVTDTDPDEERIEHLTRLIRRRSYSPAELAYAAGELPFDEVLNDKLRFGKPLMPADFERVIKGHRKDRAMLRAKIPASRLEKMLTEYPELRREEFGACGYVEGIGSEQVFIHIPTRQRLAKEKDQEREAVIREELPENLRATEANVSRIRKELEERLGSLEGIPPGELRDLVEGAIEKGWFDEADQEGHGPQQVSEALPDFLKEENNKAA